MSTRTLLFTDCVDFVGSACKPFAGMKKYVSTGAVDVDHINDSDTEIVDYDGKPSRANLEAMAGDVLFAKMQGTKKTLMIDSVLADYIYSTGFCAVRAKNGILTDRCLYHLLTSDMFLSQKDKNCSGATQKAITNAGLGKIVICVPSIEMQNDIADQLDAVISIITKRQKELIALDDLIKARFVEMFGNCHNYVTASSFMTNLRNGVSPSTTGTFQEKVLTLSAITQGRFDPDAWKDGLFDIFPTADKRITTTDFYMCRGNGNKALVGTGVISPVDRADLIFPDTVIAAHIDERQICLPYLNVVWKQPFVRDQIEKGARTTNGTYKINQKVISSIHIPLPSIPLQKDFSSFVQQVDNSKSVVRNSLDEAQLLFDSLMQEYFG